jgi:hypothetical protein
MEAAIPEMEGEEEEYDNDIKYLAVSDRGAAVQNNAGSREAKP